MQNQKKFRFNIEKTPEGSGISSGSKMDFNKLLGLPNIKGEDQDFRRKSLSPCFLESLLTFSTKFNFSRYSKFHFTLPHDNPNCLAIPEILKTLSGFRALQIRSPVFVLLFSFFLATLKNRKHLHFNNRVFLFKYQFT